MSESATINLATVGTAELEAMSVQVFASCLDTMSGEAIARFRRMRKLSNSHRVALEKYLVDHPEKRPGGPGEAPPPSGASPKAAAGSPAKTGKPAGTARRSPFPDFKKRLRAWWEGVDIKDLDNIGKARAKAASAVPAAPTVPAAKKAPAKPAAAAAGPTAAADANPPMSRIEMLQMLWGEGFNLPGGEEFTLKLLQGVDLPEGQPCLDATAGLGGGLRAIAKQRSIVVEGIESDAATAAAGQKLSERAGMAETAPIRCADLMTAELPAKRYGAAFLRETLLTLEDRKKFFSRLVSSLQPTSSLVLTDFMLADRKPGTEALQAWRAAEPAKPLPYTIFGGSQERGTRPGTENVPGIVGFGAAVGAIRGDVVGVATLRERLWRGLDALGGVRRNSPVKHVLANTLHVSCTGLRGESIAAALDLEGVAVSVGAACAAGGAEPSHVLGAIGRSDDEAREGLRFSLGHSTTAAEIDAALDIVAGVLARMRRLSARVAHG